MLAAFIADKMVLYSLPSVLKMEVRFLMIAGGVLAGSKRSSISLCVSVCTVLGERNV